MATSSVSSMLAITNAMSKVLNASMVRKMMAISSSGATKGRVMRRKTNQRDARSIAAASYSEGGMADNPASDSSITNGAHIQMSVMAMASKAMSGSDSHTLPSVRNT